MIKPLSRKNLNDGYQIYLSRDWFEIAIEAPSNRDSSDKSGDYIATFERVISRLGSMNGILLGAMLNTKHPRLKFPVTLATAVPSELRMALAKIAMSVHSAARTEGGGNSRRRISLFVRVPSIPSTELGVVRLSQQLAKPARKSRLGF